ncbi:hypothetical protein D9758_012775 [Tetrapyrgos nigripes]|uniref:S-adenosyl-L-methionine-dependent methyltransferase n=1 Tax=Tetrapyrgos nigripes TaxID=182062 RepID=A0A8H5FRV8_9AGAR|nr:hypothetical protein D9758_012775 [Tetrapyrgos nigripes]
MALLHITRLSELISQSVSAVCNEYRTAGQDLPVLHSTNVGPFDAPEKTSETLQTAIKTIEAACAQLCATIANPGHVITNKVYNYFEPACLRVATEAKISDLLLDKPEGVHVGELGAKSNRDPDKLSRILRALATNHVYTEVSPNVFANNRLSMKLLSSDPVSGLVEHMSDEAMKSTAVLADQVADPKAGFSVQVEDTAFYKAHGMSVFEMYAKDKLRAERFNQAMVGWAQVTGRGMVPKIYPWADLPKGTTVVDVGGGNGHAVLDIIKAFPHLKVIVQDTPAVIADALKFWQKENPDAITKGQAILQPVNFLEEPPVSDGDIYYLRHVVHDWSFDMAINILSNVRRAMQPNDRLLIHEFVPQPIVDGGTAKAPEPLLPNYGAALKRLYFQDLNMMQFFYSKERTLDEFMNMGDTAGFEFVKLWDGGEAGIMEFIPK